MRRLEFRHRPIEFRDNRMYVKHIVSHAEYDKLTAKYRRAKA
ncbi:TPA: type II toxin-antitoxin system HigB family toxin [Aeromonas hydrophila subsp. hydrophila]|nr:type II toxin-antitoxin system HigB family toxin [Aeromonas enteropelogenes]HDT5864797.1 type II toxin-antitoxin system HigB family toxin [Aeromonas hydrophila subsp. hydrophila]